MSVADFAASVQNATAVLAAGIVDPAVALRLFSELGGFAPANPLPDSQVGNAMADAQTAVGSLARRAAIAQLARASSRYQPSSYDDAVAVRNFVCGILDSEITVAGDSAEDATYNALRTLRAAVVGDLTARGADLAPIRAFALGAPLPALALAYRFYQDASRGDQLYVQANGRHPAFMPTRFRALTR